MEPNEENNQQKLFLKYFIESYRKQQLDGPVDFSTKQSASIHPFGSYAASDNLRNSNEDFLSKFYKHLQKSQEDSINANQLNSASLPLKKRLKSNTPPPLPPVADMNQDGSYSDRRRKNNEAAKRSRDLRRVKEDEIAIKATWLEQENLQLRLENANLKQENIQLRCQVYTSNKS